MEKVSKEYDDYCCGNLKGKKRMHDIEILNYNIVLTILQQFMWLYDRKKRRCSHYGIKEKDTLIVDTEFMGKGLIANEYIDKGEYTVPYEGGILFHRPQDNSEYVVEIRLAVDDKRRSQICYIDAKNSSSKGRYVNHSCENNAVIYKVMKAGCDIPKLWIKAIKKN